MFLRNVSFCLADRIRLIWIFYCVDSTYCFPSFLFSKFLVFIRNLRKNVTPLRGVCTQLSLSSWDLTEVHLHFLSQIARNVFLVVLHSKKKTAQKASEILFYRQNLSEAMKIFVGKQRGENVTDFLKANQTYCRRIVL